MMLDSLYIKLLLTILFWVWTCSVAPSSLAAVTLKFGVYTADQPLAVVKQFRPLLSALEVSLSDALNEPVKIRMHIAKSYGQGIDDLVSGKVDFARFGPASYIEAKRRNPEIQILGVESKSKQKIFYGVICVLDNSSIYNIEDLKGKRFAFGNSKSTIGRYLSQKYFVDNGMTSSDFAYYEYLDRHDKVGTSVGTGIFDAGALKYSTFKKLIDQGYNLREIARFPNVTKPWIAREALPDSIRQALQGSLLNMTDKFALKKLKKDGFIKGNDADYESIRQAINHNKMFFK